jgi:hypothetical protein
VTASRRHRLERIARGLAGAVLFSLLVSAASPPPAPAIVILIGIDRAFEWSGVMRPEPWWPRLAQLWRDGDPRVCVIRGGTLDEMLRKAAAATTGRKIGRLEIWSHGGPGWFRIQQRRHFVDALRDDDSPLGRAWKDVRAALDADSIVVFRTCSTFHGPLGRGFARRAAELFAADGATRRVAGFTRPIAILQPGYCELAGGEPGWPVREGAAEQSLEGGWILARDVVLFLIGSPYEIGNLLLDALLRPAPAAQLR